MTATGLHVLERKSQLRLSDRVAFALRDELKERGLTAKELSARMRIEAGVKLDYRTIQNAMGGSCGLETYGALSAFFGWDFLELVMTPVIGADPISAREAQLEQRLNQAAALHARIERERAIRSATAPRGGPLSVVGRDGELQDLQMDRLPRTGRQAPDQGLTDGAERYRP